MGVSESPRTQPLSDPESGTGRNGQQNERPNDQQNDQQSGQTDASEQTLEHLVEHWLTLPDVAEQMGLDVGKVRRLVQDHALIAVRRGERSVLSVPADLLIEGRPLADLPGTLSVLMDSGYEPESALRWLMTPDDSLPGSPLDALKQGRKTEVRRRAQALAF